MTWLVFGASLVYYSILSVKEWSWVFVSQDSGDWLSSVLLTTTPHPYGSPLYILLGKFLNLFPFDLLLSMTFVLSVIPAAITIVLIYKIAGAYVNSSLSLIVSGVVLGFSVMVTQATVLESYAIAVMFLTASLYFYQRGNTKLWFLSLGLGTAVHIIIGVLAFAWLVIDRAKWREWLPSLWVVVLSGGAPYLFTLWTMTLDTPKVFAGWLSIEGILTWLGGTDRIGTLAAVSAPERLYQTLLVAISGLGLALIPLYKGIRDRKFIRYGTLAFVMTVIAVFLYVTNLDFTTWTYLYFALPFIALFLAHGLKTLNKSHVTAVALSVVVLISSNAYFLNAGVVNDRNPLAREYRESLLSVPDGSAVIIPSGGATGMGFYYVMSEKPLIPIILDTKGNINYQAFTEQTNRKYGIQGSTTLELAHSALEQGLSVYIAAPVNPLWVKAFELSGDAPLYRVVSVDLNPDWTEDEIETYG